MQQKKYIFQILHKEIKLAPKVLAFADDTNENSIDIYIGEDRPDIGLNTYSTIGLSKFPVDLVCSDGREIRVEYIGMCNSDFSEFPNIVASCAFNIIKDNSHQLSIATDVGHMTKSIVDNLEGSEFILLESNYDTEVLRCCAYPYSLKSRIASDTGHLSNTMAGKTISYLLKNGKLSTAMLGHLSKESNFPELAYQTVVDEIISNNSAINNMNISVASRDCPSKLITL